MTSTTIVATIIAMGKTLGMRTIACRRRDPRAQADALLALGYDSTGLPFRPTGAVTRLPKSGCARRLSASEADTRRTSPAIIMQGSGRRRRPDDHRWACSELQTKAVVPSTELTETRPPCASTIDDVAEPRRGLGGLRRYATGRRR